MRDRVFAPGYHGFQDSDSDHFFCSFSLAEFSRGCKCDPSKKERAPLDVVIGKLGAGDRKE